MNEPKKQKSRGKSWREVANDIFMWALAAVFMLTLPLSFPALIVYKKARGEKIRGKGAAFLVMLWMVSVFLATLVIAAYVKKGWSGLQTLLYVCLGWALWALVVFVGMRIFIELIVFGWNAWQRVRKRLDK